MPHPCGAALAGSLSPLPLRFCLRFPSGSACSPVDGKMNLQDAHDFAIYVSMKTNIDLDSDLVAKGLRLSGLRTKKDLVHLALEEFVRRKDQKKIIELRGKIPWAGDLDAMRRNRF